MGSWVAVRVMVTVTEKPSVASSVTVSPTEKARRSSVVVPRMVARSPSISRVKGRSSGWSISRRENVPRAT